ncbi:hypothetical protein ENUP19_0121G0053 [Entamoeba nuttalli]|uniref:Transmembrane protein n=1 Tax=Entamoeba nuttalli TaxID=412467 RepID=A0ABQ0DIM6_9EUKA
MTQKIDLQDITDPIINNSYEENIFRELDGNLHDMEDEEQTKNKPFKEDYFDYMIYSVREHYNKAKVIMSYSFNTEKFSKPVLLLISGLFIFFAVSSSTILTIVGIVDSQHIFEHLFFVKLTHLIISSPFNRTIPSYSSIKLYLVIGICIVISLTSLYLFQSILSFPMQTLGQSMKFIPIILLRPLFRIPLKQNDLVIGVVTLSTIFVFVIVSNASITSFILLMLYITFDAMAMVLQSKYFTIDDYYAKLFYPSAFSVIIFLILSLLLQNDLIISHYYLCIFNCLSSAMTQITNQILMKHTRGKIWMNTLHVFRQFVKLCYSFLFIQNLTSLQFLSSVLVFLCLFLHGVSFKIPKRFNQQDSITYTS